MVAPRAGDGLRVVEAVERREAYGDVTLDRGEQPELGVVVGVAVHAVQERGAGEVVELQGLVVATGIYQQGREVGHEERV